MNSMSQPSNPLVYAERSRERRENAKYERPLLYNGIRKEETLCDCIFVTCMYIA